MLKLKDIITNPQVFSDGLKESAENHRNYKMYASAERVMGFLLSGNFYISDGSGWNDTKDSEQTKNKKVFGRCFSCSTVENIAMWMLYGGQCGKTGAMLNFTGNMMKRILKTEEVEIGRFENSFFIPYKKKLLSANGDYELFMTDVVYTEHIGNSKVRLSVADEHITTEDSILNSSDIFTKHYAWSYEKECRMCLRLSDEWQGIAEDNKLNFIRIRVPETVIREIKNRVVLSPVYSGDTGVGVKSELFDKVSWNPAK